MRKIGKYELGKTLGTGSYSKVKLATDSETGMQWAMKIVDKEQLRLQHGHMEQLKRDVAVMKTLHHPNVVQLREVMQTSRTIYFVLELVTGVELRDAIIDAHKFDEAAARRYFQQLVCAVRHCHNHGVVVRDVQKLFVDGEGTLKLGGAGMHRVFDVLAEDRMQTYTGFPVYLAPECIRGEAPARSSDVWSCGIVLFMMLAGRLPFDGSTVIASYQMMERGDYTADSDWSADAQDLVAKLLCVNAAQRVSVGDIMQHPWFCVNFVDDAVLDTCAPPLMEERRRGAGCVVDLDAQDGARRLVKAAAAVAVEHLADRCHSHLPVPVLAFRCVALCGARCVDGATPTALLRVLSEAPLNVTSMQFSDYRSEEQAAVAVALRENPCHRLTALRLDGCSMTADAATELLVATHGLVHVRQLSLPRGPGAAVLTAACPAAVLRGLMPSAAALCSDVLKATLEDPEASTLFIRCSVAGVRDVLTHLSIAHKVMSDTVGGIKGFFTAVHGLMTFTAVVSRTATRGLWLLTMRRGRGAKSSFDVLFASIEAEMHVRFPTVAE
jgi:hypothetical protein